MSDPLGPVQRGDDAATTIFDSARINAWSAAARKVRDQWPREPRPAAMPMVPKLEVLVRNDTGADLTAHSIVRIDSSVTILNVNSIPHEVGRRPAFSAKKPSSPTDQPLIVPEPIPNGEFGRAIIQGHAVARIQLDGWGYRYARPIANDATKLRTSPGGPVRIVKPLDTIGSSVLCQVFLDADCVDGWVSDPGFAAPGFAGTGWEAVPDGFGNVGNTYRLRQNVTILHEPGYYLLWFHFWGKLRWIKTLPATNGTTYAAGLYFGGIPICNATSFAVPRLSLTDYRRISPEAFGAGSMGGALNLTPATVPYQVKATWTGNFELVDGVNNGSGLLLKDLFAATCRCAMQAVRVPGIAVVNMTSCDAASWFIMGESQPSVPSCAGDAEPVKDDYTVPAGGVLSVPPPGVLANDTVPAGYYAVLDTSPTLGTLTFNSDGSFEYKQDGDLSTFRPPVLDTYTYHLSNGTIDTQTAVVTITIEGGGTTGTGRFMSSGSSPAESTTSSTGGSTTTGGSSTDPGIG